MVSLYTRQDFLPNHKQLISVSQGKEAFVFRQGLAGKLCKMFTKCDNFLTPRLRTFLLNSSCEKINRYRSPKGVWKTRTKFEISWCETSKNRARLNKVMFNIAAQLQLDLPQVVRTNERRLTGVPRKRTLRNLNCTPDCTERSQRTIKCPISFTLL